MKSEENLLWIDLEMSGLNYKKDKIIEVACIVTDKDLNIIAMGPDIPIKVSNLRLRRMDEWNKTHHKESGLIERIQKGGMPIKKAEKMILDFVKEYCVEGKTMIAGSSIHVDRRFIEKDMPRLAKYLHYRMIDVTVLSVLQKRWYPEIEEFKSKEAHRALEDIKESIDRLAYLKEKMFK